MIVVYSYFSSLIIITSSSLVDSHYEDRNQREISLIYSYRSSWIRVNEYEMKQTRREIKDKPSYSPETNKTTTNERMINAFDYLLFLQSSIRLSIRQTLMMMMPFNRTIFKNLSFSVEVNDETLLSIGFLQKLQIYYLFLFLSILVISY